MPEPVRHPSEGPAAPRRDRVARRVRARRSTEAAEAARASFLHGMSHELRTPLNAIIGYSELLREDAEALGEADLAADLGKIGQAGGTLASLLAHLLEPAAHERPDARTA